MTFLISIPGYTVGAILERGLVREALTRFQGNITQAATALGIGRPTLYELMGKLGTAKRDVEPKV